MNILLNTYCNLKCPYCFAHDVMDKQAQKMSMENFEWLLEFQKRSNCGVVRLIGGEPTLHPDFIDFLMRIANEPFFYRILVFTNGTFSNEIHDALAFVAESKMVTLLLNANHPDILSEQHRKRMYANIERAGQEKLIKVTLGLNIYQENQDYRYILDLAKQNGIEGLRWSLAVPSEKSDRLDARNYLSKLAPTAVNFVEDATLCGFRPFTDCMSIPICLLSDRDLRRLALLCTESVRVGRSGKDSLVCQPIIDVQPNMKVIRCFAMNELEVDIRDFHNEHELDEFFMRKVDDKYQGKMAFSYCASCPSFKATGRACPCLAFDRL